MHTIQCKCGIVRGQLEITGVHNRLLCYCTDCRAFAHFLHKTPDVLDEQGGTEIIQVAQPRLRFSQGEDRLAAVRLSRQGMLRWYTTCCETPIGNTMATPKASFIGLVHSCLDRSQMDKDFGTNVAILNTTTAQGEPKPKQRGLLGVIVRFIWIVATNRLSGRYRASPLFDAAGAPRANPRILSAAELANLKNAS